MDSGLRRFKGTKSEYTRLHIVMKKEVPKTDSCQLCKTEDTRLDFANVSQNYLAKKSDWMWLCRQCHRRYDSHKYRWENESWIKFCKECKEFKTEKENFYSRKSRLKSRGKLKPHIRTDSSSLCKRCTIIWANKRIAEKIRLGIKYR